MRKKKAKVQTSTPLPPNVRVKHGAYYYDAGRDETGKRPWIWLCRIDDGEQTLYQKLAELKQPKAKTLGDAFDAFLGSEDFAKRAPRTQSDYFYYINGSAGMGKLRQVFQHTPPGAVEQGHIAQYLYNRERSGAGALANKEVACLSSTYNFLMRTGMYTGANPCQGVRRNSVSARTRYPSDEEFEATYEIAPPHFQDLMMGLYLTGLRQADLRRVRKDQVVERNGTRSIRYQESKRGKLYEIRISEALGEVIARASARAPESPFIWTNSRGEPWTNAAIQSISQRLKKIVPRDWTLHDIRAKAESDSEEGLGLLPLYRRVKRIKSLEGT